MRPSVSSPDPVETAAIVSAAAHVRLDELFQRAAYARPADFALIDPPNRGAFAQGAPRYISYAAADRMVSAIAGRLHTLGLPRQSVIAMQMPNMAENVLTLLAVMRAGMIAAPLPLLWRRAETVAALGRIGARAIIAGGRVGGDALCADALQAAAGVFSIRYVCGFGERLSDGVIALDELFTTDMLDPAPPSVPPANGDADLALVTWEGTAHGPMPVARTHQQLIAGGVAVMVEAQLAPQAKVLSPCALDSFGGLSAVVVPWLLAGGTLILHQPFDRRVFDAQCTEHGCDVMVLPGPLVAALDAAGVLSHQDLRSVLALWRTPERLAASAPWGRADAALIDVQIFGETGLIGLRREPTGTPAVFPLGAITVPREGGVVVLEASRTRGGTLALRGPMVPTLAYPAGPAQRDAPALMPDSEGFVDTGYPCRVAHNTNAVTISGPPAGIVNVGGYRFTHRMLRDLASSVGPNATLAALPDAFLSHRLAGDAADPSTVRAALKESGANALVAGAFRKKRGPRVTIAPAPLPAP